MTCSASIKKKNGSIQLHSHQSDVQGTVVRLSKVCTQRFLPIFSDIEFRLAVRTSCKWELSLMIIISSQSLSGKSLGIRAFRRKTVLVNPPKFDASVSSSKFEPVRSTMGKKFCFKFQIWTHQISRDRQQGPHMQICVYTIGFFIMWNPNCSTRLKLWSCFICI